MRLSFILKELLNPKDTHDQGYVFLENLANVENYPWKIHKNIGTDRRIDIYSGAVAGFDESYFGDICKGKHGRGTGGKKIP